MIFRKSKPKRLYLPAKTKWYARRRPIKREKFWVRGKKTVYVKRQINLFKQQWFYWILGGLVLVGLFLIFFFSAYLKIAHIDVVRKDFNVNSAAIQELLKPYIGQNIILFDKNLAAEKVKENFVEYAQVRVKKDLPNILTIELESQPLVFNVRAYYTLPTVQDKEASIQERPEEDSEVAQDTSVPEEALPREPTEQKALLNGAGQVILNQEENLELPTMIIRDLTRPMEDKETILLPERLSALQATMERFKTLFPQQRIESLYYFPKGREIHLQVENGPMLWLTFQKNTVEQMDKFYSIYQPAALDQENLAYIDLRIAEKVIYCPRAAACDN